MNLTTEAFVDLINHQRLQSRDRWFSSTGVVNGKPYRLKCFNLYCQILDIDGIHFGRSSDFDKVSEFKKFLREAAMYAVK